MDALAPLLSLARQRPRWKAYLNEHWRDAERAANEIPAVRAEAMAAATLCVRQRVFSSGWKIPKRTVTTPLRLDGFEFDREVIADATLSANERQA